MNQQQTIDKALLEQFCLTIADDIEFLAELQSSELKADQLAALKAMKFPQHLGYSLSSKKAKQVLKRLLAVVEQWSLKSDDTDQLLDDLAADFAAIYLNHTFNASPMESVWLDEENLAYQDAMFALRDIYRMHGVQAENWRMRSEDHLVMQMQFIALLLREHSTDLLVLDEVSTFLDEHLLRWIGDFSQRVASRCDTEFYAFLALLTAQYLDEVRDLIAEILAKPRPTAEEIEERLNSKQAVPEATPMQYVPGVSPSW